MRLRLQRPTGGAWSSKTVLRVAFTQRNGVPDGTLNDSLKRWLAGERARRSSCYDEAGFEEQLGRHDRQLVGAVLGVTSDRLRGDVNRRVRRPRAAL